MNMSGIRPSKGFFKNTEQKDKNGFTNNSKPNYKAKGSATKQTSHRRGRV